MLIANLRLSVYGTLYGKFVMRKRCNDGDQERLAVLPDAEQYALYGLPDFDDGQRSEYLSLSPQ